MRGILIVIAATALLGSPALSHVTNKQEKALQRRESGGEAATQVQRGGLKRDRRITQQILGSEARHARSGSHHTHPSATERH